MPKRKTALSLRAQVPTQVFQIVEAVGRRFNLTPEVLFGRVRDHSISRARHIAMVLVRDRLGASNVEIGRWFGRHASTVLSGLRTLDETAAVTTAHLDILAIRATLDNRATLVAVHIASWPDGRYLVMGNSTQSNQQIVEDLKAQANKLGGPYTLTERIVEVPCA